MHYAESIMTVCTNGSSCPTGSFSHLVRVLSVVGHATEDWRDLETTTAGIERKEMNIVFSVNRTSIKASDMK